jgi:hypothetical protein
MQRLRHKLQYLLCALGHIPIVLGYRLPYWPMMRFSSNTLFDNTRNVLLKEKVDTLSRHITRYSLPFHAVSQI